MHGVNPYPVSVIGILPLPESGGKDTKMTDVMNKDDSFNAHCGPMFAEVTASLYAAGISGPKGINYIYGLGGRDVRVESIQHVFAELEQIAATGETGDTYRYLDVRE